MEQLLQYFRSQQSRLEKQLLGLLADLIAARTVNPGKARLREFPYLEVPGQELPAARVAKDYLDATGIESRLFEPVPGRANLLAGIGQGRPELLLGLHLDVVPPGEGWSSDPFVMKVDGRRLVGRGVLDNKGPLAASIISMQVLKELGIELGGRLSLAALAGEEFHEPDESDPGFGFLHAGGFLKPDFAIIPDIGENMKRVDIAEKGRMVIEVHCRGKQAHGSTPELGLNAAVLMSKVLLALNSLRLPHKKHPLLASPTINIGTVRSGSAANIVPESAVAEIDIRFVPGQTPEEILEIMQVEASQAIEGLGPEAGVVLKLMSANQPHSVAPGHPALAVLRACTEKLTGQCPELIGIGGGTFAKSFNLIGIPAVGFGPGDEDQFHVLNESISLDELMDFSLLCCLIAVEYLGKK